MSRGRTGVQRSRVTGQRRKEKGKGAFDRNLSLWLDRGARADGDRHRLWRWYRHRLHEAKGPGNRRLHVPPVDDEIEHAVIEQELAALKALWQLLFDGLLDDARPGKADK